MLPTPSEPSLWDTNEVVLSSTYEESFRPHEGLASLARVHAGKPAMELWAPFADKLQGAVEGDVRVFTSKRGTTLVVPFSEDMAYYDLYTFMRDATDEEKASLWRAVAREIRAQLAAGRRVRVATEGLVVPWLHVRIS